MKPEKSEKAIIHMHKTKEKYSRLRKQPMLKPQDRKKSKKGSMVGASGQGEV